MTPEIHMIVMTIPFLLVLYRGIIIVPKGESWEIDRLGRYISTLESGINFIVPFIDKVSDKKSLSEE